MSEKEVKNNKDSMTDSKSSEVKGEEKVVEKTTVVDVSEKTAETKTDSKVEKTEVPKRTFKKNVRPRRSKRFERSKPEFENKIVDIRRVTRVVKGGRRFSFSVSMVIGDKKGSVGVGVGKASDTALAIEKAMRNAKKNLIKLKLTDKMSIPYETEAKYNASQVVIRPAKGRGVVAGSSVRTVLELAGITEVGGKILSRSKNKLNNAKAAVKALSVFKVQVKN